MADVEEEKERLEEASKRIAEELEVTTKEKDELEDKLGKMEKEMQQLRTSLKDVQAQLVAKTEEVNDNPQDIRKFFLESLPPHIEKEKEDNYRLLEFIRTCIPCAVSATTIHNSPQILVGVPNTTENNITME